MTIQEAQEKIRFMGKKMTKIRQYVIAIINKSQSPITVPAILTILNAEMLYPNKTTIYREIDFLLSVGVIREVRLAPHIVHYEWGGLEHHHHLVCSKCSDVKEVVCEEVEDTIAQMRQQTALSGFIINDHTLEFYGLCAGCV